MTSRIAQWTLDVQDVDRQAAFWAAVLGYRAELGDDGNGMLYPPDDAPPGSLTVWLQSTAPPKSGKIRAHPDLVAEDVDAEVDRVLALGATRADIGQTGEEDLVVLADPEGNEFCILRRKPEEFDYPATSNR
jgi:predicted enzyme related to lactoylglutathione lyase